MTAERGDREDREDREDRDRRWLAQIAAGGPAADGPLRALIEAYGGLFKRFANRLIDDAQTAEEVADDVFVELAMRPLHCPADRVPLRWLLRVVRNRALRGFASARRERDRRDLWQAAGRASGSVPGLDQGILPYQLAARLEAFAAEDAEALELVEGTALHGWTIEQAAVWRRDQCRLRHCERPPTCAPADCQRGSVAATYKAFSRARAKLKSALADFL
jgi:DNA-directed RNA polymerase specialized sigma24 family protein